MNTYKVYYDDGNIKLFGADDFSDLVSFLYWDINKREVKHIIKIEEVVLCI